MGAEVAPAFVERTTDGLAPDLLAGRLQLHQQAVGLATDGANRTSHRDVTIVEHQPVAGGFGLAGFSLDGGVGELGAVGLKAQQVNTAVAADPIDRANEPPGAIGVVQKRRRPDRTSLGIAVAPTVAEVLGPYREKLAPHQLHSAQAGTPGALAVEKGVGKEEVPTRQVGHGPWQGVVGVAVGAPVVPASGVAIAVEPIQVYPSAFAIGMAHGRPDRAVGRDVDHPEGRFRLAGVGIGLRPKLALALGRALALLADRLVGASPQVADEIAGRFVQTATGGLAHIGGAGLLVIAGVRLQLGAVTRHGAVGVAPGVGADQQPLCSAAPASALGDGIARSDQGAIGLHGQGVEFVDAAHLQGAIPLLVALPVRAGHPDVVAGPGGIGPAGEGKSAAGGALQARGPDLSLADALPHLDAFGSGAHEPPRVLAAARPAPTGGGKPAIGQSQQGLESTTTGDRELLDPLLIACRIPAGQPTAARVLARVAPTGGDERAVGRQGGVADLVDELAADDLAPKHHAATGNTQYRYHRHAVATRHVAGQRVSAAREGHHGARRVIAARAAIPGLALTGVLPQGLAGGVVAGHDHIETVAGVVAASKQHLTARQNLHVVESNAGLIGEGLMQLLPKDLFAGAVHGPCPQPTCVRLFGVFAGVGLAGEHIARGRTRHSVDPHIELLPILGGAELAHIVAGARPHQALALAAAAAQGTDGAVVAEDAVRRGDGDALEACL